MKYEVKIKANLYKFNYKYSYISIPGYSYETISRKTLAEKLEKISQLVSFCFEGYWSEQISIELCGENKDELKKIVSKLSVPEFYGLEIQSIKWKIIKDKWWKRLFSKREA